MEPVFVNRLKFLAQQLVFNSTAVLLNELSYISVLSKSLLNYQTNQGCGGCWDDPAVIKLKSLAGKRHNLPN